MLSGAPAPVGAVADAGRNAGGRSFDVESRRQRRCGTGLPEAEPGSLHIPAVDVVPGKVEPGAGRIDTGKERAGPDIRQHDRCTSGSRVGSNHHGKDVRDPAPIRRPDEMPSVGAPRRREVECAVAGHLVAQVPVGIQDNQIVPLVGPAAGGNPAPVGRDRGIGPINSRLRLHEVGDGSVREVDAHQALGPVPFRHGHYGCTVRFRCGRGQSRACGHPTDCPTGFGDVEVAEDAVTIAEVQLIKHDRAGRKQVERRHVVRPRDGPTAASGWMLGYQLRIGSPIRPDVDQRGTVGRHSRMLRVPRPLCYPFRFRDRTVPRQLAIESACLGAPSVRPGAPRIGQRHAEDPGCSAVERRVAKQLCACAHQFPSKRSHSVLTVRLQQVIEEERSVRVAPRATWPDRRVASGLADRFEPSLECRGPEHHFVKGAVDAAGAGQRRFVPRADTFDHPPGCIRARERENRRRAPEEPAEKAPKSTRVVELMDMCQLVDDQQFQVVFEVTEREGVGRGTDVGHRSGWTARPWRSRWTDRHGQ